MKGSPLERSLRWLALSLIVGYQRFLGPLKRPCCRFFPTCSTYARTALQTHGFWRGSWLALRRLLRCHPYYRGPCYDPVPDPHPVPGSDLARRPRYEV